MILLALIISLASLGFRAITGKNMIFYFMREWLDKLADRKSGINERIEDLRNRILHLHEMKNDKNLHDTNSTITKLENKILDIMDDESPNKYNWILYLMKPFILCATCMASVHTLIWYPYLTGGFDWNIILVMLMVAFMNAVFFSAYEALSGIIKALEDLND